MKNKVMYLLLGLVFMLSFLPLAQAEKQPEKQETTSKTKYYGSKFSDEYR